MPRVIEGATEPGFTTEEPTEVAIDLECIVLDKWKKGEIIQTVKEWSDEGEHIIHYKIKHLRDAMKDIYSLYSNKKSTKKDFMNVLEKHRKRMDDNIHDFMMKIENVPEDQLLKIVEKKKKGDKITVVFQKVNQEDKKKFVKSIAKKIVNKLSREDQVKMFEQMINKMNDLEKLKKVDDKLKKEKPKVESKRGCFKIVIDDIDLFLVG